MFAQARQVMTLTVVFVVLVFLPISATIINVPADYDTIQVAINASGEGDTVLVAEGHYYERINFYGKGILLTSEFMLDGDTIHIQNTIIDADTSVLGVADTGSVVCFVNGEDSTSVIQGFTIQNGKGILDNYDRRKGGGIYCYESHPTISNNTITGNSTSYFGGGIYCWESSPNISNNTIGGNSAIIGGGIFCSESSPTISNNIITENSNAISGGGIYCVYSSPIINYNTITGNSATNQGGGISCEYDSSPTININTISGNSANLGGGIFCEHSSPSISNNTISGNSADWDGGGIFCLWDSNPIVVNTILWANSIDSGGYEIWLDGGSSISINYSDIQDTVWPGEGNIDADPLFCLSDTAYYWLAENSPCVGAGCDSLGNPDSTVNIGAFGVGCEEHLDISDNSIVIPYDFNLSQNYPNPFNPTTTISFTIEHPQFVTLKVYDLLGREVQTLINEDRQAGVHTITFDASGLSSGIYFYRLQAGDIAESKRMVLLK